MTPPDHTKFIAGCLTAIALVSLGCATALIFRGYTAELMVGIASGAVGSLGTMLAMRKANPQNGPGDTNVAGDATITTPPSITPTPSK